MALSDKMLMTGEHNIQTTRTHVKALILPFLLLLVIAFAGSFGAAQAGDTGDGYVRWAIVAIAVVLGLWFVVIPFLRWYLWTYTLTNRRIVEQKGILTRTGRIIPLSRINDVSYEKNLNDRILRSGTLIVHNAADEEGLKLDDVPQVEKFHRAISDLVFEAQNQNDD
ncbi:PH domain-containing protein [Aeromicrobium sp. Leaf350]|uniref:PH domain-containing protein n=1 Tax=Aeromicrobium sp. Leaf350 TaxID=2876565 RepID=UPI001E3751FE|nr:PH domain-containing protein [Aeromicrobium sp. Leaf350]